MTIVATEDTRNSAWADDKSNFGRKMLMKLGWKDGKGLGKSQQGQTNSLRAIRREESLGIGASTDTHGSEGFSQTSANFHGVLAKLNQEHGGSSSSGGSSGSDSSSDRSSGEKKKKKKKKKSKKKSRKSSSDKPKDASVKKKKHRSKYDKDDKMSSGSSSRKRKLEKRGTDSGLTLPQNRVAAGHSRKMREAKDLNSKSAADMAAVFGVKVEHYQPAGVAIGNNIDRKAKQDKKKRSKDKRKKKRRRTEEESSRLLSDADADGTTGSSGEEKKIKKKKKRAKTMRDE
mmetsp:Transcript_12737/g.26979  ORF Transcript_12737/g.26979 Transcript_12737/m.26979 type:complete len:287 (+) Transcript_12737:134-994(+)